MKKITKNVATNRIINIANNNSDKNQKKKLLVVSQIKKTIQQLNLKLQLHQLMLIQARRRTRTNGSHIHEKSIN